MLNSIFQLADVAVQLLRLALTLRHHLHVVLMVMAAPVIHHMARHLCAAVAVLKEAHG